VIETPISHSVANTLDTDQINSQLKGAQLPKHFKYLRFGVEVNLSLIAAVEREPIMLETPSHGTAYRVRNLGTWPPLIDCRTARTVFQCCRCGSENVWNPTDLLEGRACSSGMECGHRQEVLPFDLSEIRMAGYNGAPCVI